MYHSVPKLINEFICKEKPTAKEFFMSNRRLSKENKSILRYFDQYTLEAIMIHVLSSIFSCIEDRPAARVATLIDRLDSTVRLQAKLFFERKTNSSIDSKSVYELLKTKNPMVFGTLLVEFMEMRGLISLLKDLSPPSNVVPTKKSQKKEEKEYYIKKHHYAICNFDMNLLPIKLNLPMVCKPTDWAPYNDNEIPQSITDLHGGYLSRSIGAINRHRLLTSRDLSHFYIKLEMDWPNLCHIINVLQSEAFEINKTVLNFIKKNYDELVKTGLLMPKYLASLNLKEATNLLRNTYFRDKSLGDILTYQEILNEFLLRVQRARYEVFLLKLADAYDGYQFDLPAFLDFRGRIYRSGILHFHERDLARSLIVFSRIGELPDDKEKYDKVMSDMANMLFASSSFHYAKFSTYEDAIHWSISSRAFYTNKDTGLLDQKCLINFAVGASNPFQFIRTILCIELNSPDARSIPITQDASASAYQLMSYFLLDTKLAEHTNLIPSKTNNVCINDIYTFFLDELKKYLPTNKLFNEDLNPDLYEIICSRIARKLIKSLFMPIIYGKTVISMANDIKSHLPFLNQKECSKLATVFHQFWREQFPGITSLMSTIRTIGWFSAALDRPVFYSIPEFTTVQDYMKMEPIDIWLYDRLHKKRRKVTLRVPTNDRDRRKTEVSTFANFIHQKDALLAMYMIDNIQRQLEAPVYTVHDNFITTALNAHHVAEIYTHNMCRLPRPLSIINWFILINLDLNVNSFNLEYSIPTEYLQSTLEGRKPEKISPQTWKNKISLLLNSYKAYSTIVKDPDNSGLLLLRKSMMDWGYHPYNYSLHL